MREILVSVDFDFFPSICFPLFQPHPTPSCLSEHFSLSCPGFPSSARSALFFPGSMISSFCSHFSATSGHPHGLAHPFTQNLLYSYYSTAILEKSILLWSHLSVISLFHMQSETARPLQVGVFQTSRDVSNWIYLPLNMLLSYALSQWVPHHISGVPGKNLKVILQLFASHSHLPLKEWYLTPRHFFNPSPCLTTIF